MRIIVFYIVINFLFIGAKVQNVYHIFVHGTAEGLHLYEKNFEPKASFKAFINSMISFFGLHAKLYDRKQLYCNPICFGEYKNRTELFTKNDWPVLMGCAPGLCKIDHPRSACGSKKVCPNCISDLAYEKLLLKFIENNAKYFPGCKDHFYTFNWCGDLSDSDRAMAAELLATEIEKIYSYDPCPVIKLYAHSHGGNVVLQAAYFLRDKNVTLDLVVLLGAPIGPKTKFWLDQSNNISLILNCYVNRDLLQVGDVFFGKGPCERKLPEYSYVKNINLKLFNAKDKEVPVGHVRLFYLWKEEQASSILLYLPKLIKDMEKISRVNIKYKIKKGEY